MNNDIKIMLWNIARWVILTGIIASYIYPILQLIRSSENERFDIRQPILQEGMKDKKSMIESQPVYSHGIKRTQNTPPNSAQNSNKLCLDSKTNLVPQGSQSENHCKNDSIFAWIFSAPILFIAILIKRKSGENWSNLISDILITIIFPITQLIAHYVLL